MARGHYPKAYLRMDPNLDQHPDAEGMVFLMCAAARQPRRGRFETITVVERALGGRKRVQAFLAPRRPGKEPDVVQLADGTYYLTGWDEWQEGDFTVKERVARLRAKRDSGVSVPLQTALPPPLHLPLHQSEALGVGRYTAPTEPNGTPPGPPAAAVGRGGGDATPERPALASRAELEAALGRLVRFHASVYPGLPLDRAARRQLRDRLQGGESEQLIAGRWRAVQEALAEEPEDPPEAEPDAPSSPPLEEPPPTAATPAEARVRALSVLGPPEEPEKGAA